MDLHYDADHLAYSVQSPAPAPVIVDMTHPTPLQDAARRAGWGNGEQANRRALWVDEVR